MVVRGTRRRLSWILGLPIFVGALTYLGSGLQPPLYAAKSTLISSSSTTSGNDLPSGGTVKAPPLPEGAVSQAMQSTSVIVPLIQKLKNANRIDDIERERLISDLSRELRSQDFRTLKLSAQIEPYAAGNGIYTIIGISRTPDAAAELANLASESLLSWDRNRASDNIRRAQDGFRAQLAEIDQQLRNLTIDELERQTLVVRRADIQNSFIQSVILEKSAAGVLSRLSNAVPPIEPESPRPIRDALIMSILTMMLTTAAVVVMTVLDRTIRTEDDLVDLGLPTFATLPRLRQRDIVFSGIVRAARKAGLYEAIGFLRVNLMSAVNNIDHPIVMVTSTAPGEGKSTVTATLADGISASGLKVLIVDADLRRGTQELVWKKFDENGSWHQLVGEGGAKNTREALLNPYHVQVLQVEPNIDMLPAGPSIHESLSVLNQADIDLAFTIWKKNYDLILIDSAPLLALADGLVVGRHVDVVVMVSEYGRTNIKGLRNALHRAQRAGLKVAGAIINKSDVREQQSYGYSYSYRVGAEK